MCWCNLLCTRIMKKCYDIVFDHAMINDNDKNDIVLTFQSWHLRLYCGHLPSKITAETEITHPWIQNPHNCKNILRSEAAQDSDVFVANNFHSYLLSISHQGRLPSPNLSASHDMTQTLLLSSVSLNYSPQYYHPVCRHTYYQPTHAHHHQCH